MDSENKEVRCIGFVFGIGLFLVIFVLSYLIVSYPDMVVGSQAKKLAKSLASIPHQCATDNYFFKFTNRLVCL